MHDGQLHTENVPYRVFPKHKAMAHGFFQELHSTLKVAQ